MVLLEGYRRESDEPIVGVNEIERSVLIPNLVGHDFKGFVHLPCVREEVACGGDGWGTMNEDPTAPGKDPLVLNHRLVEWAT
jgi:hypothetical protein